MYKSMFTIQNGINKVNISSTEPHKILGTLWIIPEKAGSVFSVVLDFFITLNFNTLCVTYAV